MATMASSKTSISDLDFINNVLGLVLPYNSEQNTFLFEKFPGLGKKGAENPKNILDLIRYGSDFEDNNALFQLKFRSANHFYDPQDNGAEYPTSLTNYSSPDWIIEKQDIADQEYSYADARIALYEAITNIDLIERGNNFGRFFQILGQIMHHMQDMSQPEHVRGDSHITIDEFKKFLPFIPEKLDIDPSAYEDYVVELNLIDLLKDQQPIPSSNKIISNSYNNNKKVMFPMPHDYWGGPPDKSLEKKGAAEFTSNNFISKDTNFSFKSPGIYSVHSSKHPLPDPANAIITPEDFATVTDCALDKSLAGTMYWIGTDVIDEYIGGDPVFNKMTSSHSVFNSDLAYYNIDTLSFPFEEDDQPSLQTSINSCTFNAAMGFLIPRAIAFSAGIIDYMLRGRIEIRLPDEGVYSVLDHAVINQKAEGFDKIKVKLRNITEAIQPTPGDQNSQAVVQDIYDGELLAVVKYRINPCYQSDLSGELKYVYGDPYPPAPMLIDDQATWSNCNGGKYYSGSEEIVVSLPITLAPDESMPRDIGKEYTFFFAAADIPIDAIDVRLQIIFKGKLGSIDNPELAESNAIVVSTKDISEPSFIQVTNTTNYKIQLSDAENPAQYVSSGQGVPLMVDIRTHHTSPGFLLASANLQVGEYARLALLTDNTSQLISYNNYNGEFSVGDTAGFYFDEIIDSLLITQRTHFNGRGVYFHGVGRRVSDTEVIPIYDGLCDMHDNSGDQRLPSPTELKQLQDSCRNLPPLVSDPKPVSLYFN
jgi:hypothetical protein